MVRRFRSIITIAFLCVLCMSACVVSHAKTVKKKTARDAYKKYISENLLSDNPSAKYKFIDINKDGVEELVFRYSIFGRGNYSLLTYKKGKVHRVMQAVLTNIYINKKKGRICLFYSDGAEYGIYAECMLKGKKLKKIDKYYISSEMGVGETYVKDSKIISKKRYDKAKNKYKKWKKF